MHLKESGRNSFCFFKNSKVVSVFSDSSLLSMSLRYADVLGQTQNKPWSLGVLRKLGELFEVPI